MYGRESSRTDMNRFEPTKPDKTGETSTRRFLKNGKGKHFFLLSGVRRVQRAVDLWLSWVDNKENMQITKREVKEKV